MTDPLYRFTPANSNQPHANAASERGRWPVQVPCAVVLASLLAACGGSDRAIAEQASASAQARETVGLTNAVVAAPAITVQPADATVTAGADVRFAVAASGGALAYTWESSTDGVAWTTVASQPGVTAFGYGGVATADGGSVNDIPGASGATLTLSAVSQSDHGRKFRVVVANSAGSATSRTVTLTVNAALQDGLSLLAGGLGGFGNGDGNGTDARFGSPQGIAIDRNGNLYVADSDNHTIRKIDTNGNVTTLAGAAGRNGAADGPGASARFDRPQGVAVDDTGNVYVADTRNATIRKIDREGNVSTLAGAAGQLGDADGQGAAARFVVPKGIVATPGGTVFVADRELRTIRKIDPNGKVTTFAGSAGQNPGWVDGPGVAARFCSPGGIDSDASGNLYVADGCNCAIRKIDANGNVTTFAGTVGQCASIDGTANTARFAGPSDVALDDRGNVFVAEPLSGTVRKVDTTGTVSTIAGAAGQYGTNDGQGTAARFRAPYGLAADASGNIYVSDSYLDYFPGFLGKTVRKIDASGYVSTYAGMSANPGSADGPGAVARFDNPLGVAADANGNAYVIDTLNNTVRKIDPAGNVSTFAGAPGQRGSADGQGNSARFRLSAPVPGGRAAVDASGNVYVTDTNNHTIRKIDTAGNVTTFAGAPGASGFADGRGGAARFRYPYGLAIDVAGNLYVADPGNDAIRKIDRDRNVSTLTSANGRFWRPGEVAVDTSGNVYVSGSYQDHSIGKIDSSGNVSTFAGSSLESGSADGPRAAARFNWPGAIVVDTAGNVYVADSGNSTIRKIDANGNVTTVLGAVGQRGVRLGSSASARLNTPAGMAVLDSKRLLITDSAENAVLIYTMP